MQLTIEEAKEMGEDVVKDFLIDKNDKGVRSPHCMGGRSLVQNFAGKEVIQFWANYDYTRNNHKLPERMVNTDPNPIGTASFGMFEILSRGTSENNGNVYVPGVSAAVHIPRENYPLVDGYSKGEITKYSDLNYFITDQTYSNVVLTMHFEQVMNGEKTCQTVNVWIDSQLTYATKMHFKKTVIIPHDKECSKAAAAQETTCRLLIN